jgi:hypothetical protein
VPNTILNRLDPQGTDTRAAVADLGSLVIHDRSGAAVTAAEMPRLAPFIPQATDDPETARKKLAAFASNYQALTGDAEAFWRDSGYNVPEAQARGQQQPAAGQTQPQAAPNAPAVLPEIAELQRRAASNPALAQRLKEMGY